MPNDDRRSVFAKLIISWARLDEGNEGDDDNIIINNNNNNNKIYYTILPLFLNNDCSDESAIKVNGTMVSFELLHHLLNFYCC